jgi:acyl-coenzyme A thioesterase PaaI-like protein
MEPSPRRAALFRVADSIRAVLHRMVQSSAPIEVIEAVAADVEAAAERLSTYTNKSMYEGFAESANAGEPFGFFDHSPMLGQANPLAPPIHLWQEGDRILGTATFGAAYEGPPGCVHGGYVAAAFDEVLGSTQSLSGSPGMTGRLTVHYRKPTPLETELRFVGWIEDVTGRKILTKGELWADDLLCAEAEGLFISIDLSKFATMKAERDQRKAGSA